MDHDDAPEQLSHLNLDKTRLCQPLFHGFLPRIDFQRLDDMPVGIRLAVQKKTDEAAEPEQISEADLAEQKISRQAKIHGDKNSSAAEQPEDLAENAADVAGISQAVAHRDNVEGPVLDRDMHQVRGDKRDAGQAGALLARDGQHREIAIQSYDRRLETGPPQMKGKVPGPAGQVEYSPRMVSRYEIDALLFPAVHHSQRKQPGHQVVSPRDVGEDRIDIGPSRLNVSGPLLE